jgi:hypothetical protein
LRDVFVVLATVGFFFEVFLPWQSACVPGRNSRVGFDAARGRNRGDVYARESSQDIVLRVLFFAAGGIVDTGTSH